MSTKIEEIFVDMDGCLCDFLKRYRELYPERDHPSNNKEKEFNRENFKNFVETEQFRNLDPMPDFHQGRSFLETINDDYNGVFPISILGSIGYIDYMETMVDQKMDWLRKNDIWFPAIFVPGKKYKKSYAGPGRLLIDDTLINCQEWEAKGGIAIHHTSWADTIDKISWVPIFGYYYG